MNRLITTFFVLTILGFWVTGSAFAGEHHDEHGKGHAAAHGGVLSAIEECAVGHVEAKLEDGVLALWFVGGDGATTTAVRLAAREIPLLVSTDNGEIVRALTLRAKPLVLAEETVGDCSHFTATAEWLKDVKEFTAVGVVKFKGKARVLRIDFPKGFDPDHGHDDHDEDHEEDHHEQKEHA